jgi:peroxiredoxin
MKGDSVSEPKNKWGLGEIISYTLIIILAAEVFFLYSQNRDLKNKLVSMASPVGESLNPGEHVEPIEIQSLDGNISQLSYADSSKKYLCFVLSTTCSHCENNLVNWQHLAAVNNNNKCNIIGLSTQGLVETQKYATSKKVPFFIVSVPDSSFSRKYKIVGTPTTILINHNGVVEKTWVGELSQEQTKEIQSLIGV